MSDLSTLARFISGLRYEDVPQSVLDTTVNRILDNIGAACGAAFMPQVKSVSDAWCEMDDSHRVSVWGQNRKTSLTGAAFINALMGHTIEMDDVHTNSKVHIGTVVIPAVWALAETLHSTGKEVILAVLCGYETAARVGMAFGVTAHRNMGWHATSTCGIFGAAAGCAKLLGFDEEKTVYTLGLAGAQSFGNWSFLGDGASNKVLNPARAAQSGLEAALLVRAGMTGPGNVFSAQDGGLFALMSVSPNPEALNAGLGEVWEVLNVDNKPYAACRSTHGSIDGTLAICRREGLKAADIDKVEVETYEVGYKQCGLTEGSLHPTKPIHAKFSTPYTVAAAACFGCVQSKHFEEEYIFTPEVQDLLTRVTVIPTPEFTQAYPAHWGCRVRIFTKDGRVLEETLPDASGSVDNPLTPAQVKEKAVGLMEAAYGEKAGQLADLLLALPTAQTLPQL